MLFAHRHTPGRPWHVVRLSQSVRVLCLSNNSYLIISTRLRNTEETET
jgi:hypothetical protein